MENEDYYSDKMIRIWPFHEAPEEYQISQGGDEDFVIYIPNGFRTCRVGHRIGNDFVPSIVTAATISGGAVLTVDGGTIYITTHA